MNQQPIQNPTANPATPPQAPHPATAQRRVHPKKKPRTVYSKIDRIFSAVALVLSFLFIMAIPATRSSLGVFLSLFLLYVMAFVYTYVHKSRPSWRAYVTAILCFLPAVSFLATENGFLHFCASQVSLWGLLFFISDAVGRVGLGLFDRNLPSTAVDACIVTPARGFIRFFGALLPSPSTPGGKKRLIAVLCIFGGIILAIIPTAVITLLLSYDAQFRGLLESIFSFDVWAIFRFVRDLFFAIPLAAIIYGVLFAAKGKRPYWKIFREYTLPDFTRPLLCAAVTPILLVYAIFFVSQRSYYLSALTHTLPEGLTFSEYAREGFFELCAVAVINALILLSFSLLFAKKKEGKNILGRIYVSVISLFTLILIGTAISKMILYIDAYGLTQKRVWASWLMIVLAFSFVAVLVKQLVRKTPLIPVLAIGFLLLLTPVTVGNVDAAVANYNVDAYLEGELPTVDIEAIGELGSSAVPALVRLQDRLEAENSPQLGLCNFYLVINQEELDQKTGILAFNIPDALARRALEE